MFHFFRDRANAVRIPLRWQQLNTEIAMTLGDTLMDNHYTTHQGHQEDCLELQHALSQLEAKTREIIELVFIHQRSRQEVAAKIGVNSVTVTRRIEKGLGQLNQMLQMPALAA